MKPELNTRPEHLSSPPVFSAVRVSRSLVLCVVFCRSLFVILSFFLLVIVLSVLLRFTAYDYHFSTFKLFFLPTNSNVYLQSKAFHSHNELIKFVCNTTIPIYKYHCCRSLLNFSISHDLITHTTL